MNKKAWEKLYENCGRQRIKAYLAAKLSKLVFINSEHLQSRNLELLEIYSANCDEKTLLHLVSKVIGMQSVTQLDAVKKRRALEAVLSVCSPTSRQHVEEALSVSIEEECPALLHSDGCQLKAASVTLCKCLHTFQGYSVQTNVLQAIAT